MRVGVGYSDIPDSTVAGKQAAENAMLMSGREEPCDLALLFSTSHHDPEILREAVSSILGEGVPIYGGGAIGVITNDAFGYAGDQVGIACLWLDGLTGSVLTDNGLLESELDTGFRLAKNLSDLGVTPESSVILLYDAVHRDEAGLRLKMATPLLQGMGKFFGELPQLTGAGLIADFEYNPGRQYTGSGTDQHVAMALVFGEDIHVDSVIMPGSRPSSQYYTVTKADGPAILEINNRPALTFMDELLDSAIRPEEYPFFLMFGINHGERWGEYDGTSYASRLCLAIDPERGAIIMFEPDMTEGTEFQLMFRSLELDDMQPRVDSLFERLDGREPVFALYFDCAGRCAGYRGADMEDAFVLQEAIADRVPLLGIYTGAEIAPVAGRSRAMNRAGVLTLFSRSREGVSQSRDKTADSRVVTATDAVKSIQEAGIGQIRTEADSRIEALRKLCEQNAAKILALDAQNTALRYEKELRQRGFQLIAELAVSLRQKNDYEEVFVQTVQRINAALNMEKTAAFLCDGTGVFRPVVLQGFSAEEQGILLGEIAEIPMDLQSPEPVLVTGADSPERMADFRARYGLPFFVSSPVFLHGKMIALFVAGRTVEQPPFLTRLGSSDMETVHAIAELVGSVMVRIRLVDATRKAEIDGLTGLWNRITFQNMVERRLEYLDEKAGVFIMLDLDNFKQINDNFGHLVGDHALKESAIAIKSVLRDSDIVGRQGGDEFVAFCFGISDREQVEKAIARIEDAFNAITIEGLSSKLTASIGVATAPLHGRTFMELYGSADRALHMAKRGGRNRSIFAD